VSDPQRPEGQRDGKDMEDTQAFRAFVERGEPDETHRAGGAPFRILTLLAGLAAFVVIVLLLLR
jgi:hypothetical protein